MAYGDKRDYPKIDIYWRGLYRGTTTWAKTCKEAKQRFFDKHPNLLINEITARKAG